MSHAAPHHFLMANILAVYDGRFRPPQLGALWRMRHLDIRHYNQRSAISGVAGNLYSFIHLLGGIAVAAPEYQADAIVQRFGG
jgi:hypothetical protein